METKALGKQRKGRERRHNMRPITDHSPNKWEQEGVATLLLSFDEWAEVEGYPWIRVATEEELEELKRTTLLGDARDGGRDDAKDEAEWNSAFRGPSKEPYLVVTVLASAPGHIWRQATSHLRLRRFK